MYLIMWTEFSCFLKFSRFVFLLFCSAHKGGVKFALQFGLFSWSPSAQGGPNRADFVLGRLVPKNSYRSNVVAPARPNVLPPASVGSNENAKKFRKSTSTSRSIPPSIFNLLCEKTSSTSI